MTLLTSPTALLLLRTTLLLGLALLTVRLLRRRGPAVQTLAGRAALAAVALLLLTAPLTHFVLPLWHVPAPATPRPAAQVVTPTAPPPQFWGARAGEEKRAGASPAPTLILPVPAPPVPTPIRTPSPTPPELGAGGPLLLLWATGTALLLLWLAICQGHLTRLHRRALPLTDGPTYDTLTALTLHPPRLYACSGINGPFLAGLVRPAIYLPADHAKAFSPDALRAVLVHELAHANRNDTRWTLAARLLCALLWPQPLLWLLCRQLDHLSEDACDLAVLAHACPPRVYADCLLTLAERRPHRRTSPLTASVVPFRSQLARRIQHILTVKGNPPMPTVTRRLRFALPAAAVLAALGGTLLIAAPAPKKPALWQSVSTDPQSPLVGVWLFKGQPLSGGLDALLVYRADGREEFIAPGTGGHNAEHNYFTYRVNGDQLTEQMKDQGTNDSPTVLHFNVNKSMLTIHDAIEDSTGERVADAAQASLVEKMLTETHAKPGAVVMTGRSTLTLPAPVAVQHRTFTFNLRVPRSGTHHIQVFVKDDTGQRTVYDKMCPPGANITVPITGEGTAVTFAIYNDGKLVYATIEGSKSRIRATTNEEDNESEALLAERTQLVSQFSDAEAHIDTLKTIIKVGWQQAQKRFKDIKMPHPPITQIPSNSPHTNLKPNEKAMKQQIRQQIAAAQNEIRRRSSLPPQNPDRLAVQRRLDDLLRKQQFIFDMDAYRGKTMTLLIKEGHAEIPLWRSIAKYRNKQRHLQGMIDVLDVQIAAVKAKKS